MEGDNEPAAFQNTVEHIFDAILVNIGCTNDKIKDFIASNRHLQLFSLMKPYCQEYDKLLGLENYKKVDLPEKVFEILKSIVNNEYADLATLFELAHCPSSIKVNNIIPTDQGNNIAKANDNLGSYFKQRNGNDSEKDADSGDTSKLKEPKGESKDLTHKQKSVLSYFEHKTTESGIEICTPKLFHNLLNILNGDRESLINLILLMKDCFRDIIGAKQLVLVLSKKFEGTLKDIDTTTTKDLLALIIYSAYSSKDFEKDSYIGTIVLQKYKHSIKNLDKIHNFFNNLVNLINDSYDRANIKNIYGTVTNF